MARGKKGTNKTANLTETIAVKLTPSQKQSAVMASLQLGAKAGEALGNQGIGLAALQLAVEMVESGQIEDLLAAYKRAVADQESFLADLAAEPTEVEEEALELLPEAE